MAQKRSSKSSSSSTSTTAIPLRDGNVPHHNYNYHPSSPTSQHHYFPPKPPNIIKINIEIHIIHNLKIIEDIIII
uniref:Uncharacterized protein n=1 Tax=Meloidogyne enterolobii TaxID=390850 RepID=A0A6V7UU29_MELEN|nr:unnamed protein product [Meloidogyne enterolobii]